MSWKTFLSFGCVHRPIHEEESVAWLLQNIEDYQPDYLVCNGDLLDLQCLSRFAANDQADLLSEFDSANEFLCDVREASPNSKLVWTLGNHDVRVDAPEFKALAGVLDINRNMEEAKRWKQIPYGHGRKYTFQIGQLTFAHGTQTSNAGIFRETLHHAPPFGCFIHSHTHQPVNCEQMVANGYHLPWWRCNTGTYIDRNVDYARKLSTVNWGVGLVRGACETRRRHSGKREWEAETLVLNRHVEDWE